MRKSVVTAIMATMIAGTFSMTQMAEASPFQPAYQSYSVAYDAHWILSDHGFVKNKTTYMSVTDVVYVVEATGFNCAWGNDNLIIGHPLPVDLPKHHNGDAMVFLDGQEFKRAPVVHLTSATSKTYIPIWYVMQALVKAGKNNSWNGREWIIGHLFA